MVLSYTGFVYIITNLKTGRKYIGKKLTSFTRSKKPLKGKTRRRKERKDSGWRDYYGSNKELHADIEKYGKENFKREILHFCKTKGTMSYLETMEQIQNKVLESSDWYNDWIQCKISRSHIKL